MNSRKIHGFVFTLFTMLLLVSCACVIGCSRSSSSAGSDSSSTSAPAATSDADSSSSANAQTPSKAEKNGFDSKTNQSVEAAGVSFELPAYFEKKSGTSTYYAETGRGTTFLQVDSYSNVSASASEFDNGKKELVDRYLEGMSTDKLVIDDSKTEVEDREIAGLPGSLFRYSGAYTPVGLEGAGIVFYNQEAKAIGALILLESSESQYDYLPDFYRILDSATLVDESSSATSASASGGEVSPDLKEMLDSYEAFMDEYVEFMKTYQDSSDTLGMLSEYTNYMQRYTDFMNKVEKVDTSNMSAADYDYYLEVTTRVTKKLLEVSGI